MTATFSQYENLRVHTHDLVASSRHGVRRVDKQRRLFTAVYIPNRDTADKKASPIPSDAKGQALKRAQKAMRQSMTAFPHMDKGDDSWFFKKIIAIFGYRNNQRKAILTAYLKKRFDVADIGEIKNLSNRSYKAAVCALIEVAKKSFVKSNEKIPSWLSSPDKWPDEIPANPPAPEPVIENHDPLSAEQTQAMNALISASVTYNHLNEESLRFSVMDQFGVRDFRQLHACDWGEITYSIIRENDAKVIDNSLNPLRRRVHTTKRKKERLALIERLEILGSPENSAAIAQKRVPGFRLEAMLALQTGCNKGRVDILRKLVLKHLGLKETRRITAKTYDTAMDYLDGLNLQTVFRPKKLAIN